MVNKNFLLINPYIIDVAAYDLWNKPIGLLYIASILKRNQIDFSFIDLLDRFDPFFEKIKNKWGNSGKYYTETIEKKLFENFKYYYKLKRYGLPKEEFIRKLKKIRKPDLILITSHLTYWYKGVLETAEILKDVYGDIPIILGGNAAILTPEIYKKSNLFERVFENSNLSKFYDFLENKYSLKLRYKPIKRRDYPYPYWELYSKKVTAALQSSWGCPYHCTYCASNKIYPFFFQRNPKDVLDEIDFLIKLGFSDIAFYDDALLINAKTHIIPILKGMIKNKYNNVNYHLPNAIHPQFLTQEISDLMYEASFKTIAIGHDTKSVRAKQQKVYPLDQAIGMLKRSGFKYENIWIYLLVGLPYQTLDEIYEEMDRINDLGATIKLAWFSPIPGTIDYLNLPEKYEDPFYYNNSLYSIIAGILEGEEVEKLKQYERELNRRLYD